MKKLIFSICATIVLFSIEAKQPNTINVDPSGVVSKGASKLSAQNYEVQSKNFSNRKPDRSEITDVDPRQMNEKTNSWFSW